MARAAEEAAWETAREAEESPPVEEDDDLADLFPQNPNDQPVPAPLAGRFGTAQLEDANLTSSLQQVSVVDGKLLDGQVAPRPHLRSPLIPLPIISVPFSRIGIDLVGPLPWSSRGHQYILVVLDYATRYPEAIPLRTIATKGIARELMLLFSRVGLPEEILTDQGTPLMSRIMRDLCQLMKVTQLRTSVYHPQTDGLVERFNLKKMLKKTMEADGRNWDQLLPFVLFTIREVPQAFSPFELLYGRRPRGLLDLAKEAWEQQPSPHRTMVEDVEEVRERMATIWPMVREHMAEDQTAQARVYNRGAQPREFAPGDKLLVLVPTS
ncbi:hypothetical protein SKAU_G00288440 [Synaphobranchus kaupii]|uniref:Integrase catalytic domain-containing protein n=1 Tax=Synaphobranchus kaupii TaxID=118154 RepID=A0A9Q1IM55_SYNKA|nr:hypothetical protein SKAU_G00288440 [Synaphobranchus kaupii]